MTHGGGVGVRASPYTTDRSVTYMFMYMYVHWVYYDGLCIISGFHLGRVWGTFTYLMWLVPPLEFCYTVVCHIVYKYIAHYPKSPSWITFSLAMFQVKACLVYSNY